MNAKRGLAKQGVRISKYNSVQNSSRYLGPLLDTPHNNKIELAARKQALEMRKIEIPKNDFSSVRRHLPIVMIEFGEEVEAICQG